MIPFADPGISDRGRRGILGIGLIPLLTNVCSVWVFFFVFCLMSHSRKFSIHGEERHFCGKGLQNFVGCPAFTIFDQGGIFIVPHMYSNGASSFMLSFEGLPLLDALYIKQGVLRIYCNLDPKGLFVVSTKNEINIVNIAC